MTNKQITFLIVIAFGSVLWSGCTTSQRAFKSYADREGVHTLEAYSIYGRVVVRHVNLKTNETARVNVDGSIDVNPKP